MRTASLAKFTPPILVDRDVKVVSMNARGRELEQLLEKHIGPVETETK